MTYLKKFLVKIEQNICSRFTPLKLRWNGETMDLCDKTANNSVLPTKCFTSGFFMTTSVYGPKYVDTWSSHHYVVIPQTVATKLKARKCTQSFSALELRGSNQFQHDNGPVNKASSMSGDYYNSKGKYILNRMNNTLFICLILLISVFGFISKVSMV